MFRRIITLLLLLASVFPVLVSFGSHDFKHAMHVIYESQSTNKTHEHTAHNHSKPETLPQHHPIDISLGSFFKDYFYGRSQISTGEKNQFVEKAQKKLVDSYLSIRDEPQIETTILPVKQMEPGVLSRNDLYLKTQRLRIDV